MDRELALTLARILVITMRFFRIGIFIWIAVFVWEILSNCSLKSMIAQITISTVMLLCGAVRIVTEIRAAIEDISTTIIIIIVAFCSILIRVYLIKEKKEWSYSQMTLF